MKKLVGLIIAALTFSANASQFRYQIRDNALDVMQPFFLNIDLNGPFVKGSEVTKIWLTHEVPGQPPEILFTWEGSDLKNVFQLEWSPRDYLVLYSNISFYSFPTLVKKELPNLYGNGSIIPNHKFAVWFYEPNSLSPSSGQFDVTFAIIDLTLGQKVIWGDIADDEPETPSPRN